MSKSNDQEIFFVVYDPTDRKYLQNVRYAPTISIPEWTSDFRNAKLFTTYQAAVNVRDDTITETFHGGHSYDEHMRAVNAKVRKVVVDLLTPMG